MRNSKPTVLILPGLSNSGPQHWQSLWQVQHPEYIRVMQREWDQPVCAEWSSTLDQYVTRADNSVVLVGHSLACATIAYWAANYRRVIQGALLVAPSDTEAPSYPPGTQGFNPMPLARFDFPSIVVTSTNDRYVSLERAHFFAAAWGSRLVNIGAAGHINADAGFGVWPEGEKLLQELL